MKSLLIIILSIIVCDCAAQDIFHPAGLDSIAGASGDLDNDGIAERVIVYDTKDTTDFGVVRELQIFRKVKDQWQVWIRTRKAVMASQEGGMMGDPFQNITVTAGILIISFDGGSSWKWSHSDKYRFQNNSFQLIGYSSYYGRPCDYWTEVDYNLSTGKLVYKKEYEDCENGQKTTKKESETFINKGIKISLQNRYPSEIKITTPKYKADIYF